MTIRKRNDADGWKRGAMGIDGRDGDRFTKQYAVDPYDSNPRGDFKSPKGAGVYQDEAASFLRRKSANDDPEQGKYTLGRRRSGHLRCGRRPELGQRQPRGEIWK